MFWKSGQDDYDITTVSIVASKLSKNVSFSIWLKKTFLGVLPTQINLPKTKIFLHFQPLILSLKKLNSKKCHNLPHSLITYN